MSALMLLTGANVLCSAVACSPPAPKVVRRAEGDVKLLRFAVLATGESPVEDLAAQLEARLGGAGYRMGSPSDYDIAVELTLHLTEDQGVVAVVIDGKRQVDRVATVQLRITADENVVQTASAQFDADDPVPSDVVDHLTAAVTNSVGLRQYAQRAKARATVADRRARELEREKNANTQRKKEVAQAKMEAAELAAWNQIVLAQCTSPQETDGCEAVREFIQEYPTGKHVVTAKAALEVGTKKIQLLKDERAWVDADATGCRSPKVSTSCEPLRAYMLAHPTGQHAEEGQAILAASKDRIAELQASEEREGERLAQQAEREEARLEKEQCKKDCLGNTCFNLKPGPFEICMARCVKAYCE